MAAVTLWRVVMLRFDTTDLFVDEAQYWLWGQHLDFGYYSKPPMIAWMIRLFNTLTGSNSTFSIRLSAPLFHLGSGLVLMRAARRLLGTEVEPWVGVIFVTLPGASLSSVLVSTDTVQIFFISIAVWAFVGLNKRSSVTEALMLGISLGLAFMTKYSVLFLLPGVAVAMATIRSARVAWRDVVIAAIAGAIVVAPNLWWNLAHDAATVRHTQNIAHWDDARGGSMFHPAGAIEFFLAQFGVVGPLVFYAILLAAYRMIRGRSADEVKLLVWLSLPAVALITLQALFAKAYANWAVAAYAAGTILAVHILRETKRGLSTSLIIGLVPAILIPILTAFSGDLKLPNGELLLKRYMGRSAVSLQIADVADRANTPVIVVENRDILADLFYTLRDKPYHVYARDLGGFPTSYYEQMFPLPATTTEDVLFVATEPFECKVGAIDAIKTWQPDFGFMRGKTLYAYRVAPACMAPAK
jgi:4-amino-4-deoxy-L-arabinose transferase-like glycosyltransferase